MEQHPIKNFGELWYTFLGSQIFDHGYPAFFHRSPQNFAWLGVFKAHIRIQGQTFDQVLTAHAKLQPIHGAHINSSHVVTIHPQRRDHIPLGILVVQGFGIGSLLLIIFAHDLKHLDISYYLHKYADDASLLSPQNSPITPTNWKWPMSCTRQEKTKCLKTNEIVFHRPNVQGDLLPHALTAINRVCEAKLTGVCTLDVIINFSEHAESVVVAECCHNLKSRALIGRPIYTCLRHCVQLALLRACAQQNFILYALPVQATAAT